MLEQQILNFEDRHILATANNDVFDPPVDADVTLVVHVGEIPRVEPAFRVERLDVGPLVVAQAHLRAPHLEEARLADGRRRPLPPPPLFPPPLTRAPPGV